MDSNTAEQIAGRAVELGYESCGVIGLEDVDNYAGRLAERIERVPESAAQNSELYRFVNLREKHPWAESIIVCVQRYGQYRVPEHLKGLIAKYYLFDGRTPGDSPGYQTSLAFEQYLASLGLRVITERRFGLTALRWAAQKANLGIIRRNNFFYTGSGSWVFIEAWLVDRKMEWKPEGSWKPCPPKCDKCVDACPTGSLCEAYTMSRASCVSALTTWIGDDLINNQYSRQVGGWVYGCDACQDACPFNARAWRPEKDFPGLDELGGQVSLPQLVEANYEFLRQTVAPKFWYIAKDRVWKWKVNALNAMLNNYQPRYLPAMKAAGDDPDERVRQMAAHVLRMLEEK